MKKAVLSFIILLNLGLFAQEYSDYVLNYPNGNIKEKGVLHLGLKEGTWEYYSPDGKLMAKVDYHKDMLHGENIIYYSDGKVKRNIIIGQMSVMVGFMKIIKMENHL